MWGGMFIKTWTFILIRILLFITYIALTMGQVFLFKYFTNINSLNLDNTHEISAMIVLYYFYCCFNK